MKNTMDIGTWEIDLYNECRDIIHMLKHCKGLKRNFGGRLGLELCLKVRIDENRNCDYNIFEYESESLGNYNEADE